MILTKHMALKIQLYNKIIINIYKNQSIIYFLKLKLYKIMSHALEHHMFYFLLLAPQNFTLFLYAISYFQILPLLFLFVMCYKLFILVKIMKSNFFLIFTINLVPYFF